MPVWLKTVNSLFTDQTASSFGMRTVLDLTQSNFIQPTLIYFLSETLKNHLVVIPIGINTLLTRTYREEVKNLTCAPSPSSSVLFH